MVRNTIRSNSIIIIVVMLAFSLSISFTSVHANAIQDEPLCGNGSAPDYGLSYNLFQPHWTVGWEGYASERAVSQVDAVLDELDADSIAQTMILIKPQEEVGIRSNCSVHFLRYMQLGLPNGERKDNGFVFLIVVEPDDIDVHYAVGLGLPALTAYELTNINRAVETAYESTQSMDQALLTLVQEFDKVARENYPPLTYLEPTPETVDLPVGPLGVSAICGQLCLGLIFLLFMGWMFSQMARTGGMTFNPSGSRSWGGGGFRGFPSGGGRSSGPSMRGGSGSGRSGRTN
ncbi:MAG: hypothetical protein H7Y59_20530 [Anaerolineales bacterium]|nr:hypothetical protein [Anaerolineales bacterium]